MVPPGFDVPGFEPGFEVPGLEPGFEVPGFVDPPFGLDGDPGFVVPGVLSPGMVSPELPGPVPVLGLFGLVEPGAFGLVGFPGVALPVGGLPMFPVGG